MAEIEEVMAGIQLMSNAQLMRAYVREHDKNMSGYRKGEIVSGDYEDLLYDEIEARMSGRR